VDNPIKREILIQNSSHATGIEKKLIQSVVKEQREKRLKDTEDRTQIEDLKKFAKRNKSEQRNGPEKKEGNLNTTNSKEKNTIQQMHLLEEKYFFAIISAFLEEALFRSQIDGEIVSNMAAWKRDLVATATQGDLRGIKDKKKKSLKNKAKIFAQNREDFLEMVSSTLKGKYSASLPTKISELYKQLRWKQYVAEIRKKILLAKRNKNSEEIKKLVKKLYETAKQKNRGSVA